MRDIHEELRGRESLLLDALGIPWPPRGGRRHIRCPLGTHEDRHPSWRWDARKSRYHCTCGSGSIVDAIMQMRGLDFVEAARWARQTVGIKSPEISESRERKSPARVADLDPSVDDLRHATLGLPSAYWVYRDVDGVYGAVARYETQRRGKAILPWIWDGARWVAGAMPAPRPLYQTDELRTRPSAPVLIAEGEKTADAAQRLFSHLVVTTSAGGAMGARHSDWSLLRGRTVVIWPDADSAGRDYARQVGKLVTDAGAASVRIVDVRGLPDKWDLADDPPPGVDLAKMLDAAIRFDDTGSFKAPLVKKAHAELERIPAGVLGRGERNVVSALEARGISLSYNAFAQRIHVSGLDGADNRVLTDAALDRMYVALEREHALKPSWEDFCRYVRVRAHAAPYHPIRDYLDSLEWDGIERIGEWLHAYGGAENTELNQAFSRIVLIAAVRRVRQPGCKFDEMLVLESPEGRNKSSALALLAGGDEYFSDDAPINCGAREVIERLRGRWIVECSDLRGVRRAEVEHLKSFLSRRVDSATLKYEREVTDFRRQCIFVGTTNDSNYLVSTTGNRRFWPVKIEKFDLDCLARDRDQLWAEAAYREARGESIRLPEHLWGEASKQQDLRGATLSDPWYEALADALDGAEGKVSTDDIWKFLGRPLERCTPWDHQRLSDIMRRLGWVRSEGGVRVKGRTRKGFVKGAQPYREVTIGAHCDDWSRFPPRNES